MYEAHVRECLVSLTRGLAGPTLPNTCRYAQHEMDELDQRLARFENVSSKRYLGCDDGPSR